MKIKNCPFCGTIEDEGYLAVVNAGPHFTREFYAVYCDNCGATGPVEPVSSNHKIPLMNRKKDTKLSAVANWNGRHLASGKRK